MSSNPATAVCPASGRGRGSQDRSGATEAGMQEGLWGRRAGVMQRTAYGHLGATAWSRKPRLPDEETASRKQRQL